jgi:hypothetical protein
VFPLVPGKSYPQPNDPGWPTRSHEFEALERTFILAAPLIHVDPEISIGGITLHDHDDHNYSKLVFNTHCPWEDQNPQGGTSQEYSFRSLDPRDLRGVDINFDLTGRAVDNAASKSATLQKKSAGC